MNKQPITPRRVNLSSSGWWWLLAAMVLSTIVYRPGLSGSFLFDDYPNIVNNHAVQPSQVSISSLVGAAMSSPASEFKRPLASLSFAANYLVTGLDPYWMKLTNLIIHLLNGLLVFVLARALLQVASFETYSTREARPTRRSGTQQACSRDSFHATGETIGRTGTVAALIAGCWMLLPINLTGVLYVVQRMESMANLFVLLGLIGYVAGRRRMLNPGIPDEGNITISPRHGSLVSPAFWLCVVSIVISVTMGVLAKETAVMLPLYALSIEWILFRFRSPWSSPRQSVASTWPDRRIVALFLITLALPLVIGLAWVLPGVLNPKIWATRDFGIIARLLSEARIVCDYIVWTLLPTADALSFYHDNFRISSGLLTPWTTLSSIVFLAGLSALMIWLRKRQPLAALGLALFLGCQLLTGTILPLELIYEHRNYFASFGLLLAIIPLLAARGRSALPSNQQQEPGNAKIENDLGQDREGPVRSTATGAPAKYPDRQNRLPMPVARYVLLAGLMLSWTGLTAFTAYAWGHPLRLAEDLAKRAPQSPRAQYELGRTYIINSHYDPASPFTQMAYAPLERAAALPNSSILPEQALIFMNSRMQRPLKQAWWDSMISKLRAHKSSVQDDSSLAALTQCDREGHCDLPKSRMIQAFQTALSHRDPSSRLLATYGDYAWNVLDDDKLGLRMTEAAVKSAPDEPAYQITLIRMLAATGQDDRAREQLRKLRKLNTGGRLDESIHEFDKLPRKL